MRKLLLPIIFSVSLAPEIVRADYPNLAWSTFDDKGTKVYDTNNVVKVAIEQKRLTPLRYDQEFKNNSSDILKEIDDLGNFELNAYVTAELIQGIQGVVGEFACATHRHYSNKPQVSSCNGVSTNKRRIEAEPFVDGQYASDRISTTINSKLTPRRSYDIFLKSKSEEPLSSLWGAVHELGSFLVTGLDNRSIVLTVNIKAFALSGDGERVREIQGNEQVVLVILPRATEIGSQDSETEAKRYAIANAKVLVPVYSL